MSYNPECSVIVGKKLTYTFQNYASKSCLNRSEHSIMITNESTQTTPSDDWVQKLLVAQQLMY